MWYEYLGKFNSFKVAGRLLRLYFDLFPAIKRWQTQLCVDVDRAKRSRREGEGEAVDPWTLGVCSARNPFGYTHRFYNVLDWSRGPIGEDTNPDTGESVIKYGWTWTFGEDAKRLVSFLPQSTAAAIIKRAAKRIWFDYPWIGESLRLLIHDSILGEAPEEQIEACLEISQIVMEEPIPELP